MAKQKPCQIKTQNMCFPKSARCPQTSASHNIFYICIIWPPLALFTLRLVCTWRTTHDGVRVGGHRWWGRPLVAREMIPPRTLTRRPRHPFYRTCERRGKPLFDAILHLSRAARIYTPSCCTAATVKRKCWVAGGHQTRTWTRGRTSDRSSADLAQNHHRCIFSCRNLKIHQQLRSVQIVWWRAVRSPIFHVRCANAIHHHIGSGCIWIRMVYG